MFGLFWFRFSLDNLPQPSPVAVLFTTRCYPPTATPITSDRCPPTATMLKSGEVSYRYKSFPLISTSFRYLLQKRPVWGQEADGAATVIRSAHDGLIWSDYSGAVQVGWSIAATSTTDRFPP